MCVRAEGLVVWLPSHPPSNDAQLVELSVHLPSLSTTQLRVPHAYLLRVLLPSQPLAQPRVPHASMPFLPLVEL